MTRQVPDEQLGPAERLLDLVLNSSEHLWHNRPGVEINGVWVPRRQRRDGVAVSPGLHRTAATRLYARLLEIYTLNAELMAHFASYALLETEWRDLKIATAALMLVQPLAGQPVLDESGEVAFHEDDYRAIGEAMVLYYERGSKKMLNPKGLLRIAELLECEGIAELNRAAGFASGTGSKPPLGRWKTVAKRWLGLRESNTPMLNGLVKAGFKESIKKIARKAGYKPQSKAFFEALGWKQKQAEGGHREVGMDGLDLRKSERFDDLSEAEICERIVDQGLGFKEAVGRLPKAVGLTPAIMVALLPSLSDRDLRILTPTLEELGLLAVPAVRARWDEALQAATDQRALNIAKNVRNQELRAALEGASDSAARQAVAAVTKERDIHVMFLIDKSGSMEGAIEQSKEALSRILAGFPMEKIHIASFDTSGTVLRPKAANRTAIQHMLARVSASGGTQHAAAVDALGQRGVRIPPGAALVVVVVGDEAGERGEVFARAFERHGFRPAGIALIVNIAWSRGQTVRDAARYMSVPFSEVTVDQFKDAYQVPRILRALMEAPILRGDSSTTQWVQKIMAMELLDRDRWL